MKPTIKSAYLVIVGIVCVVGHAVGGAPNRSRSNWTLSFTGFGPVKVGMTVHEVEKALKIRLDEEEVSDPAECHYALNEYELPGVSFMLVGGKIVRVDVSSRTYRTVSGARLGMTEEAIKRLYPQIKVEPHQYDPAGHYLILTSRDLQYGIVFETDGNVVTDFRGGEREAVAAVERCL